MDKWEMLATDEEIKKASTALIAKMKIFKIGSSVNKILIINKEIDPTRLNLIFVKEKLGF